MSMIPWDYNLAFGTFQGGSAYSSVNDDIGEVLSDRPMQVWIFSDETYSQQYYALYAELLEQVDVQGIIDHAHELIAPYVEKDPTAFCTYAEFQSGVETLKEFCKLRSESVTLQLSGNEEAVDVGTLDLSDMGTMNHGMGGGRGDFGNRVKPDAEAVTGSDTDASMMPGDNSEDAQENMQPPNGMERPEGMQMPDSFQFHGHTGMTGAESGQNSENSGSTGNTPPNGFGDFGNGAPSGGIPDLGNMGDLNGMPNTGQGTGSNTATLMLLAVSILFLAVGLIVAFKFKR